MDFETILMPEQSTEVVPINASSELYIRFDAKPDDFDALCGRLAEQADKCAENQIGDSRFFFAAYGDRMFSAQYVPNRREIRLVREQGAAYLDIGPTENTEAPTVTPLLSQLELAHIKADCGMSYILRAADGAFVVIDGGDDDYEESERLFETLCAQSDGKKPRIAAWIITHLHPDHTGAFCALWEAHKNDIGLERLLYNIVPEAYLANPYPHERFDRLLPSLVENGVALITVHTGMHFSFSALDIDFLYAPEDVYPTVLDNFNDSSLIFRVTLADRRILFLGDAMPFSSDRTAARYAKDELSCTYLQVGHHGYGGGSDALNRACDPEILLWPCPAFWYPSVRLWESNDFLRHSKRIRETLLSGFGAVTLPFPLKEDVASKAGDVLYASDYASVRRVIDLKYESVTGGATGLTSAEFSLESDAFGRYVKLATQGTSLVGLVRQNVLKNESYTAVLRLRALEAAKFGIMANNDMPNLWQGDKTIWTELASSDKPLTLTVTLDYTKRTLALVCDGQELLYPLEQTLYGGLYLALENTALALYGVTVKKI